MVKSVLLDTSFFIRFLNINDPLFKNADDYFKYFIVNNICMIISTISIAEFCIKGRIDQLPLMNMQILPFTVNHAIRTGEIAGIVFDNKGTLSLPERKIITNDTKLFAQADVESSTVYYLSSDSESMKIYNLLKKKIDIKFQFIDLKAPISVTFNMLFD